MNANVCCYVMSCLVRCTLSALLAFGPNDPCFASCVSATNSILLVNTLRSLRDLHRRLPLRILNHITHECTTQQNRRLVQIVVLVAQRSHTTGLEDQTRVVRNVLADPKARRKCPCATTSTSKGSSTLPLGLPIAWAWNLRRMSAMTESQRAVISAGDLEGGC
jgi:hypothetical protein